MRATQAMSTKTMSPKKIPLRNSRDLLELVVTNDVESLCVIISRSLKGFELTQGRPRHELQVDEIYRKHSSQLLILVLN